MSRSRRRFDLHAGLVVRDGQRDRLERVCRYALRPPLPQDRLHRTREGEIGLTLRHRWADGTTHLRFEFDYAFAATLAQPEMFAIAGGSAMSVKIRKYMRKGRHVGWDVDVRVRLPTGERYRERTKLTGAKSAAQRWGEERERDLLINGRPKPKKEVPTLEPRSPSRRCGR